MLLVRTNLVKHLVTLIEHEGLDMAQRQLLVTNKSIQATGGADNDVRVGLSARQLLNVLLDGGTTVEHGGLDIREILGEASILVLDLVSQLTSVAHDENRGLSSDGLQLVEGGQDKDGGLTQTGLGLAKNIDIQDGSRDADLLDCGEVESWLDLCSTQEQEAEKKNNFASQCPSILRVTHVVTRISPSM